MESMEENQSLVWSGGLFFGRNREKTAFDAFNIFENLRRTPKNSTAWAFWWLRKQKNWKLFISLKLSCFCMRSSRLVNSVKQRMQSEQLDRHQFYKRSFWCVLQAIHDNLFQFILNYFWRFFFFVCFLCSLSITKSDPNMVQHGRVVY